MVFADFYLQVFILTKMEPTFYTTQPTSSHNIQLVQSKSLIHLSYYHIRRVNNTAQM